MATELREIDIRNYWPSVVGDTDEFQQIAEAENPEFNALQASIYQVLKEAIITDETTEYGVKRWESMLNITPESGDTLDERKVRLRTYLTIKLPYTWRVLEQMLIGLLGEENVSVKYNNDAATLTVSLAISTTQAQIADVETLVGRVLPKEIVTEMEWADGLPIDYIPVEYLESTGTQYIETPYYLDDSLGAKCVYLDRKSNTDTPFVSCLRRMDASQRFYVPYCSNGTQYYGWGEWFNRGKFDNAGILTHASLNYQNSREWQMDAGSYKNSGELTTTLQPSEEQKLFVFAYVYYDGVTMRGVNGLLYSLEISSGSAIVSRFVPALDPIGTPCMFDTVSKQPFYNSGTGDFLYPGAEQAIQTSDLDAKSYAKLTPHGVRRLYHVPKGFNMSVDEYAAANGFKELVEPPMPLDGYWEPQWRETDTQLILDWIETEPPNEEVTEND